MTSLTLNFSNSQPLYPDLLWQYGEVYGPHLSMLFLNVLDKIHGIAKEAKYIETNFFKQICDEVTYILCFITH